MVSGTRFGHTSAFPLVLVFLLMIPGCSVSLKDTPITFENQAQILEQANQELTVEEARLLQGYLARTYPGLGAGELPMGRTLGEMIADQRAFEGSAAGAMQAESASGGTMETEPPVQQSAIPGQAARPSTPPSPQGSPARPGADEPSPTPAAGSAGTDQPAPVTESAEAAEPSEPPAPEPAAAAPVPTTVAVPSGTSLRVRLASAISSKTNDSGDTFEATLDDNLMVGDHLVAPEGSRVTGTLTHVQKSGKVKGRADLSMTISRIEVNGERYALKANTLSFEASGTAKKDAKKIGIATGIGAAIGAIAGGGKGAAIGSAIGAGAGTGVVLATPGEQVEFGVETPFEFTLQSDLEMKILQK